MASSRTIGREIGTAFAALAIYLLTILTPLHQARASQLDFARLGYATIDANWALCGAPDASDTSKTVATKCPVTSTGKQHVAPVLPVAFVFNPQRAQVQLDAPSAKSPTPAGVLQIAAPPRAPPAQA
ncbi:hypothetical protein [Devosia sp.]|uniref:hypothetical protein n=1 Tax=Devosia sp. TaxID=1871048 RepID=UPI0032660C5A